jgi:DNA-binding SARP family transcriptional activator
VAQRRRLALLALLGTAGDRGMSRDKLAGYLWPESDEADARHLLSDSVYVLRRALGEDGILAVGEFLRLNPELVWCDVVDFEAAIRREEAGEAVDLYAGPFLDGFYLGAAGELDQWVETERRRLADGYAKALESLAERAESASDFPVAVERWKQLAAHDAFNSRYMVRLMEALIAAGDPGNALQRAQEHEHLLREELGTEPAPEVLELAERRSWRRSRSPAASRSQDCRRGGRSRRSGCGRGGEGSQRRPRPGLSSSRWLSARSCNTCEVRQNP